MPTTIEYRFRLRRRTASNWTSGNEVLLDSEMGLESDTRKFKFGDGTTAWDGLPYASGGAVTSVAGKTGVVTLVKGDVGLGSVDNTADTAKPVSTAQQTALDLKANLSGATFSGGVGFSSAITYGGVTLTNAVTGAGKMVLATGPVLAGTTVMNALIVSGSVTSDNNVYFSNANALGFGSYFAGGGGSSRYIASFNNYSGANVLTINESGHLLPGADNTQNVGGGSLRWGTIYSGTGTINTSDERHKVLREGGDLTEAEYLAWSNVRAIVYRDKDSFATRGYAARLHVGLSWQAIKAAFEAQGLDPTIYGLWCEDPVLAPVVKACAATRQAVETVQEPYEEVQILDGVPVLIKGVRSVEQPVFESIQVRHAKTGKAVTAKGVPLMAPVPVMEEYVEEFTVMEPTGETIGGLRYQECSVIEAAWLRRELAILDARMAALERGSAPNSMTAV